MKKSLLAVLVVATVFFVTGCACCKSKMKKTCPMESMKQEEMVKPADAVVPEAPVVEEVVEMPAEAPAQ